MNLIQEMGIKDLEHVVLKARDYFKIGPYSFEPGEPVLYFNNIQIALLSENATVVAARGGYLNQPRVIWEDRSDTTFQFSNGTLNPISLNMLLEADMLTQDYIYIPKQELIELDEFGVGYLNHQPVLNKPRFYKVFDVENIQHDEKFHPKEEGLKLTFDTSMRYKTIVADYYFEPKVQPITYTMNRERKAQLYSLEATFYLKDENDGLLHTGVLEMPKVYIMSNINLRMGERADPSVGTFRIVAMPDALGASSDTICRISYIDEDIYGI